MRKYIYGLLGILIGFSLSITITTHADSIKSLIGKIVEGEYPISINGAKINTTAIVINNISYIPVRAVSGVFGLNVSFNKDSGIELTQTPAGSLGAVMGRFMGEMGISQSDVDAQKK